MNLILKCIPALLALLIFAPAPASAESYAITTTHATGDAWYPLADLVPMGVSPQQVAAGAVEEIRTAHPKDLAIDLGLFTDPISASETAYDSANVRLYYEQGFAAMNLTPRDFAYYAGNEMGAKRRPPEMEDFFLSAFDVANLTRKAKPLPAMKVAEHDGRTFALASVAPEDALDAFPRWQETRISPTTDEIVQDAVEAGADVTVLLSSHPRERNIELAQQYPDVDLIIETGAPSSGRFELRGTETEAIAVEGAPGVFIVPAPAASEFQRVLVNEADDGRVASVSLERSEWIPPSMLRELQKWPLPVIGVSVPPKGRVAERLRISQDMVNVEVHRRSGVEDLTTREDIYVYIVALEGETLRVYRVRQYVRGGYLPIDMLVLVDEQRRVRRIDTNLLKWPIVSYDTTLGTLIRQNYNKPPQDWTFDGPGVETVRENLDLLVDSLEKTVELDRRLYGD